MTKDEALRLALEALENAREFFISTQELGIRLGVSAKDVRLGERFIADRAITAIKAALEANDEPVPVAIVEVFGKDWRLDYMALPVGKHKLYAQQYTYTTPPQRKPLTDEEITEIFSTTKGLDFYLNFARAIEAAHGIKDNT